MNEIIEHIQNELIRRDRVSRRREDHSRVNSSMVHWKRTQGSYSFYLEISTQQALPMQMLTRVPISHFSLLFFCAAAI